MKPKDQDPKDNRNGLIYSYKCQYITYGEEYIEETSRSLGERCKEHLKGPSPIHVHIQCTGHNASSDNFNIIGREHRDLARTIKEAIYIRVKNPSLNRHVGKYHLSHLWGRFLFNIPGLKIDSTQHPLHIHNNGFAQTIPTNSHFPIPTGNWAFSEFRACAQRCLVTHIIAVMLGCSQTWWRSQWWLKACLCNNQMVCLREKPYQSIGIRVVIL